MKYNMIKVYGQDLNSKFRLQLKACATFSLARMLPKRKRLLDNVSLDIHVRHHDCEGEARFKDGDNVYRPRNFQIIIDKHRLVKDDYQRECSETEHAHKIFETLCHECVHVKQYLTNELTFRTGNLFWKGHHYDVESMLDYHETPYEIEAYGRQRGLLLGFLSIISELEDKIEY